MPQATIRHAIQMPSLIFTLPATFAHCLALLKTFRSINISCALFMVVLVPAESAYADIVSTMGMIEVISAPSSVRRDVLENDEKVRVFVEVENLVIPVQLRVDITQPGYYAQSEDYDGSPGLIPAGTAVNSYYFHADSFTGTGDNPSIYLGSITFDTEILGIDVFSNSLDNSKLLLESPSTLYPFDVRTSGLEVNQASDGGGRDFLVLSDDRLTVTFNLRNAMNTDQFRVITAVPEASTLLFCSLAGLGFAGLHYRRVLRRR